MSRKRLLLICLLAIALILAARWDRRELRHPPGPLVTASPVQTESSAAPFRHGEFQLTPRAEFEVSARVLATERYYLDRGAALAPVDFALGWGPMSDQSVLDRLTISQSGRWYFLRWSHPEPIPGNMMFENSGNMHLIPASMQVRKLLKQARSGQVIELRGKLVDADRGDGFRWRTSLSRTDQGDGSCELFWVEQARLP